MTINYEKLDLPLYPGDTVYYVGEEHYEYDIMECKIKSIVISEDKTLQFIIDCAVESFGDKDQVFPTREEAEDYINSLRESFPRHIRIEYSNSEEWRKPEFYLPEQSMEVLLTLNAEQGDDPDRCIHAFFIRDNGFLCEGFYLISPSAYDKNYNIDENQLKESNTKHIPIECIFAWRAMQNPTHYAYKCPPLV